MKLTETDFTKESLTPDQIELYSLLAEGLRDVEEGRVMPAFEALEQIRRELNLLDTPTATGNMTKEQSDAELMKGVLSAESGKTYTTEEIDKLFSEEFAE